MADKWTAAQIPDQSGRVAAVTGANSGIGFHAARELARAGARVILAVRDTARGERAAAQMPGDTAVCHLDLASLASVREFASSVVKLDLLVNNAGVMAAPRRLTEDGFETHFQTNHLGHFALTGLLLKTLLAAAQPRVVTVSSDMHRVGRIDFEDLQGERSYDRWKAYGNSKMANLLFCFEQLVGAGGDVDRQPALRPERGDGALPTLYASTVPDLPGGSFVGPDGRRGQRGHPHPVTAADKAYDDAAARRLWEVSAQLTGVSYEFR